jgi:uncharacterized membrane protein
VDDLWLAIRGVHLLAMAFFVGGQLVLVAAVVPGARRSSDPEVLRAIARRFGYGTLGAVGLLLATGSAMASHYHRWGDSTLQVKLGLVALVGLLIVWHLRRPTLHALEGAIFVVSLAIVWLGLTLAHGA